MTSQVSVVRPMRAVRPLPELVPLIQLELQRGDPGNLEHYRTAGELLLECKAQIPHGEWGPWLSRHFRLSHATANAYMQLARIPNALGISSLREARGQQSTSIPDDGESRQALARALIEAGYKVLARHHHPDRGGSSDVMARLNAVRSALTSHVARWKAS